MPLTNAFADLSSLKVSSANSLRQLTNLVFTASASFSQRIRSDGDAISYDVWKNRCMYTKHLVLRLTQRAVGDV